jgi:hypothetical protein
VRFGTPRFGHLDHDSVTCCAFLRRARAGLSSSKRLRADVDTVLARVRELLAILQGRQLGPELRIVVPGRVRVHQSSSD